MRWCYAPAAGCLASVFLTSCRLLNPDPAGGALEVRVDAKRSVKAQISSNGDRLGVRFLMRGKDRYASSPLGTGPSAAITFQPNAKTIAGFLGPKPISVPVFSPAQWRILANTMALRLAPSNPKEGTLILAGRRELIAHRVNGKGVLTSLEKRPGQLKVTKKINGTVLAKTVFDSNDAVLSHPDGRTGPVLYLTGTFPELVYLDRQHRRLQFLTVPPEETSGLSITSLRSSQNALQQLGSFFWHSHVLAVLKNPFSTCSRLLASGSSITSTGVGQLLTHLPQTAPPPLSQGPEMDPVKWQLQLSKIASTPASQAQLRLRLGGDEFFPDFIQAVQDAKKSVDVQIYIFDNDDYAVGLADLLRKRSQDGVKVRVLLDESASLSAAASPPDSPMPADFVPPDDMTSYLKRGSKVKVRRIPMSGLTASHTKIISIDDQVAWLGGMNLGREYRYDWHDLMIEVRGPLVQRIRQDFAGSWARYGLAGDLAVARQRWFSPASAAPSSRGNTVSVQPLYTSPWKHEILQAQLAALRSSQRSVWLQNAYLSHHGFITELVRARHRGVDVRIILPAANDNGVMAANNRALIPLLRSHGIRVFLLPGMSHIKAALYDGWACLGSANFDRLSLHVNNEFSIGCSDPSFVHELRQRLFEIDFQRSQEVNGQPVVSPDDALINILVRSLAGQL